MPERTYGPQSDLDAAKDKDEQPAWRQVWSWLSAPNHEFASLLPRLTELLGADRAEAVATTARQGGDPTAALAQLGAAPQNAAGQNAGPKAPIAAALPAEDELIKRIVLCIGIWETNRNETATTFVAKESALDTFAGVKASMATSNQIIMAEAITQLRKNPSLQQQAAPPLTKKELNDADARCVAVTKLLKAVEKADAAGDTPQKFVSGEQTLIAQTGLEDAHVYTMFDALDLKAQLAGIRANWKAAVGKKAKAEAIRTGVDAIPQDERLGLDFASLSGYIKNANVWGEHRAGWQRLAVDLMPGDVGARIEQVATAGDGTNLAVPKVAAGVKAELARNPQATEETLVPVVAQQNNPNEPGYGEHVWAIYQRLYHPKKP